MIPQTERQPLISIDWNSQDLPTMPSIAQRLISMLCKEEVETSELCDLIAQDPALTAKLLQISNSALYSLSAEVTSIKQAVVLLGQQEVIQLAVSSLLAKRFLTVPASLKDHAERLWKHLMTTAILSQDFEFDIQEPDLYTLSMLHDVGWLVIMSQAPTLFISIAEEKGLTLRQLETKWGVDHELWGAKLLERWTLPEPFQVAAYRHHHPFTDAAPPKYLLIISLANYLANAMGHNLLEIVIDEPPEALLEALGLDRQSLMSLVQWAISEKKKIEAKCRLVLS
ncbi:MAG: HDOD domain-containing protein [Thermodesulfobacteria bacterium]|nr:HDOD domain-containing protein [Thermodesulfobacteriota bacterium]